MKNQNTKPTKKKIILSYLILAACLVIIASVTVGVIFAVRNRNAGLSADGGNKVETPNGYDENKGNDDENKGNDDDNKPTDAAYSFICPVSDINLSQSQVFAYDKTLDRYCVHSGIDLKANAGTDVLAAVDGTILEVSVSDPLYGAVVAIQHADGVKTVYKFIDPNESLKAGSKVSRGQVIGKIAVATGIENAEGDHLHFEVYKNNVLQDPSDYLDVISK